MFTKFRTNEKGFTLIELLIVVAIIGILAAIAIPQFGAYRVRGYNSAASSDIRNLKIAEEAFVTDWQVYASTKGCVSGTAACTGPADDTGTGVLLAGPLSYTVTVAAGSINTSYPSAAGTLMFGLSSGVVGGVTTTATTGANYTAHVSHSQGDIIYGADSDFTSLKQAGKDSAGITVALTSKVKGAALTLAPVATTGDDLTAALFFSTL